MPPGYECCAPNAGLDLPLNGVLKLPYPPPPPGGPECGSWVMDCEADIIGVGPGPPTGVGPALGMGPEYGVEGGIIGGGMTGAPCCGVACTDPELRLGALAEESIPWLLVLCTLTVDSDA